MSTYLRDFGENEKKFKTFVKDLRAYNNRLEIAYIAMAKLIRNEFIGKPIGKKFYNRFVAVVGNYYRVEFDETKLNHKKFIGIDLNTRYVRADIRTVLSCYINFEFNFFTENDVKIIVERINLNRERVAKYEDAAKHFKKYIKQYEKAVNLFVRTMESINPIFADISVAQNISYTYDKIPRFELFKWDEEFKQTLEPYVLD